MRYSSQSLPEGVRKCLPKAVKQKLGKAGLTMTEIIQKSEEKEESEMHRLFSGWLNQHNIEAGHADFFRKSHYTPGFPDFVLVIRKFHNQLPIPIAIEFKTESGVLSDKQLKCIARMTDNGWQVHVAKSVDGAIRFVQSLQDRI